MGVSTMREGRKEGNECTIIRRQSQQVFDDVADLLDDADAEKVDRFLVLVVVACRVQSGQFGCQETSEEEEDERMREVPLVVRKE